MSIKKTNRKAMNRMLEKFIELLNNIGMIHEREAETVAEYLIDKNGIILPCKLGDTIYDISEFLDDTINNPDIYRYRVDYIRIFKKYPDNDELWFEIDGIDAKFDDFGKTLFLSEKEAEQALKRSITSKNKS